MAKVICYKSDPAELRNDCEEMRMDNPGFLAKPVIKFCREEKLKKHLIVIRGHFLRYIIMLTFDKYVKLDELYFSIVGLIHNDKRQSTHIEGYLHTDLQYAYEAEVPHTDKFSVYHGMWNTFFKHLCKRSFRINYSGTPNKIIAKAGAYEVLEKFAEALRDEQRQQYFKEYGKFAPGTPSFPIFYEENPYDYEEEIVDDMEEKYGLHTLIHSELVSYPLAEYVFDTSKIQDKSVN